MASAALAGCFESGTPPAPSQPTGPRTGGGNETLNLTLRQFVWDNCTGLVGIYELPYSNARAVIPSAFVPYSPFPTGGTTASFLFDVLQCERVVAAGRVVRHAGIFASGAHVRLANASWGERDVQSRYTLDLVTTSTELTDALASVGIPSKAANLEATTVAQPWTGIEAAVHAWKYVAPDLTVEVEYFNSREQVGGEAGSTYEWFAENGTFRRAEARLDIDSDVLIPGGVLRLSGQSETGRLLNACCIPWTGQGYYNFVSTWNVNATEFGI